MGVVGLKHIVSYLVELIKEIATLVLCQCALLGTEITGDAHFLENNRERKMRKSKADTDTIQTEELLQAVVLADSFDTKFMPITLEMPRVSG